MSVTEEAIPRMVIVSVVGFLVGALLNAVFLQAAIGLYNNFARGAGSLNSVPSAYFGKAFGISVLSALASIAVGRFVVLLGGAVSAVGPDVGVVARVSAVPLGLLITAGVVKAMLPTSFGKAILVTLLYLLIVVVVTGTIAVAFFLTLNSPLIKAS